MDIVDNLIDMHDLGYLHGDVREANVVIKTDGKTAFVDLEDMQPHRCERTMSIRQGAISPCESEFGCSEIFRLVDKMEIWSSGV